MVPSSPRTPPPWLTFNASDEPFVSTYGAVALLIDFRLDELCQVSQRLLPTEIASLQRNGIGQAFLHNIKLGAERDFLERHRHLNLTRQVGIVEFVSVAQAFMGHELNILAAKRMRNRVQASTNILLGFWNTFLSLRFTPKRARPRSYVARISWSSPIISYNPLGPAVEEKKRLRLCASGLCRDILSSAAGQPKRGGNDAAERRGLVQKRTGAGRPHGLSPQTASLRNKLTAASLSLRSVEAASAYPALAISTSSSSPTTTVSTILPRARRSRSTRERAVAVIAIGGAP